VRPYRCPAVRHGMGKKGGKRSGHVPIESRDGQISTSFLTFNIKFFLFKFRFKAEKKI
jgi:hypothetical protein